MTKKERNKTYVNMLNIMFNDVAYKILNRHTSGLCYLVRTASGIQSKDRIREYPELMRHKPPHKAVSKEYWWRTDEEGSDKRICVLIEAIMDTL